MDNFPSPDQGVGDPDQGVGDGVGEEGLAPLILRFTERYCLKLGAFCAKAFILAQVHILGLNIVGLGPMRAPSMEMPFGINGVLVLAVNY